MSVCNVSHHDSKSISQYLVHPLDQLSWELMMDKWLGYGF